MAYETVNGYCWPQSIGPNGTVSLHLSSTGDRPVTLTMSRVGATEQIVWEGLVPAAYHPTPNGAYMNGCDWPAALAITADPDWQSGYYQVEMTIDVEGKTRTEYAFFVLRPPADSPNTILLQLSTNTWHAYNDFGGRNLYTGATTVSLQRPMSRGYLHKPQGAGRRVTTTNPPDPDMNTHIGYLTKNHLSPYAGSAGWPDWELPFIQWAERAGYGIDICTNADLEEHPRLIDGYNLLLSVGHDEYWSGPMRDTVEGFIAKGGNAAFFSGNTAFWQVRMEDPAPTTTEPLPNASMVGYKGFFKQDPVYDTDRIGELTSMWSDHEIGRPENHMTGVSFTHGGYHRIGKRATNGAGGYTIHQPDHWLFDGTDIDYGDLLGAESTVVGYECDGCDFTYRDGRPYPTGTDGTPENFVILGTAPAPHFTRTTATRPPPPNQPSEVEFIAARLYGTRDAADVERISAGHAIFGSYVAPSGGVVVTSGSCDWAHGLAGRDPQIEQITHNVLRRLGSSHGLG